MPNRPALNPGGERRILIGLTIVTNVALFAVAGILMAAIIPPRAASTLRTDLHFMLIIDGIAALAAILIAPTLLNALERMQQRVGRQNAKFRALHGIDSAIMKEDAPDRVLQMAVRQATMAMDGEYGAAWLFSDDEACVPIAQAFYGLPAGLHSLVREWIFESSRDGANRLKTPQRFHSLNREWAVDSAAAALRLESILTAPIVNNGEVLGVVMIANRGELSGEGPGFTEEDEEILTALAATVGIAVTKSRMMEEARRRGEMLRTLIGRTGEAIAASSDSTRLMQLFADEAAGILGCVRVAIYEFDDGLDQFLPLAIHDSQSLTKAMRESFYHHTLQMDAILPPSEDEEQPHRHYVANVCDSLGLNDSLCDVLSLPGFLFVLRSRDRSPIGILCFLDAEPRPQSPESHAFARALSSQASVALENARLAKRTHALLAQAEALQEATHKIAAELDPNRVLDGVMASARRVLNTDGYAFWVRDPHTGAWSTRAQFGLTFPETLVGRNPREAEVLGMVMLEQAAQVIGNMAHAPLMRASESELDRGAPRALLALPLLYGGNTVGVLALYYRAARTFLPAEVSLAQSFAHQAANAMENARLFAELQTLYAKEKRAAETMQLSLLPQTPQVMGSFEFASIYKAGLDESVIGGDFLDLIRLNPTHMGIVIADVSGKGLRAAVQTAMIKYTLRAFAQEDPTNPAAVVSRVNDVFCADSSGLQGFITLFYGVLDVLTGEFRYAVGGHETPLLCRANGAVSPLEVGEGIALGCQSGMFFDERSVTIGPLDSLLLYTDGLTEARDIHNTFLGIEGLQKLLTPAPDARVAVHNIYDRVRRFAGDVLRDDAAMMVIRRSE
ncbi:SpoIIE family protein phosphatase [Capsulimonas corticalis]|nr:SpoIIE family protein phosphatase [Capsulimonas corticalis]